LLLVGQLVAGKSLDSNEIKFVLIVPTLVTVGIQYLTQPFMMMESADSVGKKKANLACVYKIESFLF
jgi:hypothetical protein